MVVVASYLVFAPFYEAPLQSFYCVLFVSAGIPFYLVFVRCKVAPPSFLRLLGKFEIDRVKTLQTDSWPTFRKICNNCESRVLGSIIESKNFGAVTAWHLVNLNAWQIKCVIVKYHNPSKTKKNRTKKKIKNSKRFLLGPSQRIYVRCKMQRTKPVALYTWSRFGTLP